MVCSIYLGWNNAFHLQYDASKCMRSLTSRTRFLVLCAVVRDQRTPPKDLTLWCRTCRACSAPRNDKRASQLSLT